jgi:O-antigen ligase/polysaccharide polymerase Wzy-like membrane protein
MFVILIVVTVSWGALAFGAVYTWAYVPLAVGCALAGVWGLLRSVPWCALATSRRLATGAVLVTCAIAAQVVPLPRAALVAVSPSAGAYLDQHDVGYALRAASGPWHALHPTSLNPSATCVSLGLFSAFALFLLGCNRGLTAKEARAVAAAIAVLGLVMALVGIIQRATFNGKLYWFWVPEAGSGGTPRPGPLPAVLGPFGPFVSRNNFAGWMLLALPFSLAYFVGLLADALQRLRPGWRERMLWFSSRGASRVVLVGLSVAVMAVSLVMTVSRSGIACFAAAVVLIAAVVLRNQRSASRRALLLAWLGLVVATALAGGGLSAVLERFSHTGLDFESRRSAWEDTLHLVHDYPLTGAGLGTYSEMMLTYERPNPYHLAQAHNDYLQLLAEGGVLVAAAAVVFIGLFIVDVRKRFTEDTRDATIYWVRVGAVTGFVALALQETIDFSLQMPGIAALCALLMAIASGPLPHRAGQRQPAEDRIPMGDTGSRPEAGALA